MRHLRVMLPALAIVLTAAPAQARTVALDSARVVPAAATTRSDATIPVEVRAMIDSHRAQARAFFEAGRYPEARRELLTAASLMREAGVLPTEELITVATIALVEERPLVAAQTMDDLAANAEAFGQPAVEAQALLEAATQYAAADRRDVARERCATLRTVLASSPVPDQFRAEVASRIDGQ